MHPLRNLKLGSVGRWLLTHAPSPEALFGLELAEAEDRTTREGHRKSARKLEGVGLLEVHDVTGYTRAPDPRAEGRIFKDGGFWRREDPTRAHAVRRTVVWRSPFGQQIVSRYEHQLWSGAPIRWDAHNVLQAQETAARLDLTPRCDPTERLDHLSGREEKERDRVVLDDHSRRALRPEIPEEVASSGDTERWELAIAVRREKAPDARPDLLWDMSLELWRNCSLEELQTAAAAIPKPRPSAGETFRRQVRSPLGQVMKPGLP